MTALRWSRLRNDTPTCQHITLARWPSRATPCHVSGVRSRCQRRFEKKPWRLDIQPRQQMGVLRLFLSGTLCLSPCPRFDYYRQACLHMLIHLHNSPLLTTMPTAPIPSPPPMPPAPLPCSAGGGGELRSHSHRHQSQSLSGVTGRVPPKPLPGDPADGAAEQAPHGMGPLCAPRSALPGERRGGVGCVCVGPGAGAEGVQAWSLSCCWLFVRYSHVWRQVDGAMSPWTGLSSTCIGLHALCKTSHPSLPKTL